MTRFHLPDLWHLEKALTAAAMMISVIAIVAVSVLVDRHLGWLAASLASAGLLALAVWAVIRFIPLSEYRNRP